MKKSKKIEELELEVSMLKAHLQTFKEQRDKAVANYGELENKLKKEYEEKKAIAFKTMELKFKEQHMNEMQKLKDEYQNKIIAQNEKNYDQLKASLAKLHDEGNANTKYLEKVSLTMMDALGSNLGSTKRIGKPSKEI
jgi:chromosome segregation ATPase